MATPTLKSTYSLDLETLRTLESLANRWRVSKSAALRRAIRAAAQLPSTGSEDALRALDTLQRTLGRGRPAAGRWAEAARAELRASSGRLVRGRR
jgi:hypothetical protein